MFFCSFLLFFLGVLFFLEGFKGQARWPEGPPHLALNPPYLFFCFAFFVGVFLEGLRVRWGGPALNPPYLLFPFFGGVVVFSFPFFAFWCKKLFSPRRGLFLFIFEPLPFFLLSLFWPPPFSISLSLSLFVLFFSSSFFFAFFWFLLFVSFFPFVSSLLLFHERNNIKTFNWKFCFHQYFLFLGFPVLFFLLNPFFLCLSFLLILSYVFCSTWMFFGFKTNNLKKTSIFGQEGGCNKSFFFIINLCLQNVKSYRFLGGPYFGKFWLTFKKHYKHRSFSTFLKAENKRITINYF